MGAWGTAIYSCDIAADVREACNLIFAFFEIEEGNKRLFSEFSDIVEQGYVDNEYASFWYALADWQWKHGMLNKYVKDITLNLLEKYAGIEEWDFEDIPKRKKVLEKLRIQLQQSQPILKKPRKKVSKPKHKPGDLIIIKTSIYNGDEDCYDWKIKSFTPPIYFKSSKFRNSKYKNIDGFDAAGKYIALLCVGTVKESISEYINDIFDEYSVYVWYDYLSFKQPSIEELSTSGFLPYIDWTWKDFNKHITESVVWGYEFAVVNEKFKKCKDMDLIFTLHIPSEVERYRSLISKKNYSSDYFGGFSVYGMFSTMFEEKNRALLIGEYYDNLLNSEVQAPQLLPPKEVDVNFRKLYE